tara:strand:- start:2318 stop:3022 length:705 start_codon:yes stop_codon:yes gene_type:complete
MKEKKMWAIIPARGNSKGVLNKNIKNFCGSSLLERSITALKESKCFDKIIVTSDEKKIINLAKSLGVLGHLRIEENESLDHIMTDVPVLRFLEGIKKSKRPEFCFMIQCTAPFMNPKRYVEACAALFKNQRSTIFAAAEAHQFLWEEPEKSNSWRPINHPFNERVGRQFIKKIQVHETGAFYGFNTEDFIKSGYRFHTNAIPLITSKVESIDINDEEDWKYAEYIYNKGLNDNK